MEMVSTLVRLTLDKLAINSVAPHIWSTREIHVICSLENPLGEPDPLELTLYFYSEDRLALHQLWMDLKVGETCSAEGIYGFWQEPPGLTLYGPTLIRLRDSKVLWRSA